MLSDRIQQALEFVGITERRVSKWLGAPCGCQERKEKLDDLERWAKRIVQGKVDKAKHYLEEILGSENQ